MSNRALRAVVRRGKSGWVCRVPSAVSAEWRAQPAEVSQGGTRGQYCAPYHWVPGGILKNKTKQNK